MRIDHIDHLEFIKGLKKGDYKAYSYMVDTYHHALCSYALALTDDYELSKDIVQTVYIKIWDKRTKIKDDVHLLNYLYKSVYNAFIDQYRKRRPVFSLEKIHIDSLNTFIQDNSETNKKKLIDLIKKEIENLPPKCKKVFLLSRQEGLTNIEIAEHLSISKKSVEGHITKAFAFLRNRLGNQYNTLLFLLFPEPGKSPEQSGQNVRQNPVSSAPNPIHLVYTEKSA
ncbi:MAG: RNA polymerase sigma-70 factor, partial [Bacteroidota bacterium]